MPHTELKQTLADAIRMMERAKITDFSGHFSARVPGTDYLMINSAKSVRSALTVDDIVTIDMDGKLVEGVDTPPMEFHIHTEIYRRRKDVQAVAHAHAMWSTFFTMAGVPVKPVMPTAAVLGEIRVFPRPDSINYKSIAEELAAALGARKIILLRSHGAVIAAEGVIEAFVLAAYLEENACTYSKLLRMFPICTETAKDHFRLRCFGFLPGSASILSGCIMSGRP